MLKHCRFHPLIRKRCSRAPLLPLRARGNTQGAMWGQALKEHFKDSTKVRLSYPFVFDILSLLLRFELLLWN
jgi:hypothetical protein